MRLLKAVGGLGALCAALLTGCSPSPPASTPQATQPQAAPQPLPTLEIYAVTGAIREIKPDGLTAMIRHEEIPGYMQAMTMPFRATNTSELANLLPGDRVQFRLIVSPDESWVDQVRRVGAPAPSSAPAAPAAAADPRAHTRIARAVEPLNPGDRLPNYTLTNELGQVVRLHDFAGKALAFTFIFTRCPLPDFCPRMSNRFAEAAQILADRSGGPTNWHLLSISFDVEFDSPAVLKGYAERYRAGVARWNFASGALSEIDPLAEHFGLQFSRDEGPFNFNHNLRTVVVDAAGKVHKIFIGNQWTAQELADEMALAAAAR